ncbi:MAG: methyltransferase domain-containing protein [Pseudomonadota bacterium]
MLAPPETLTSVLACPRSGAALELQAETFFCAASNTRYPIVDGVPWLFAEPEIALAEWRQRFRYADATLASDIATLTEATTNDDTSAITQQRLRALLTGKQTQRAAVAELLAPLEAAPSTAARATYLALRTRLPPDQGLHTYTPNIIRDWADWGDAENASSLAMITDVLDSVSPTTVLVLGAGAGRLTHDINITFKPTLCVGLDFNPLLMLIAAKLSGGDAQSLVEFPLAPKTLADHALVHQLKASTTPAASTQWVLGDALRAPFREEAFDLVVTPWLTDIVAEPPTAFAPRINRLLKDGGQWINFGSIAFRDPDPVLAIGREELTEQIEAAGFQATAELERDLPYLASPASRHRREETIAALRFTKTATVQVVPRWRALPDWIVIGKTAVPASDEFLQQAAATRIHAFIMALIDGKRSLKDMASIMEQRQLMPAAEAEDAIRGFLIKMYDDARRYSGF